MISFILKFLKAVCYHLLRSEADYLVLKLYLKLGDTELIFNVFCFQNNFTKLLVFQVRITKGNKVHFFLGPKVLTKIGIHFLEPTSCEALMKIKSLWYFAENVYYL